MIKIDSQVMKNHNALMIIRMLGAGRTELLKSIFGADPYDSGEIYVKGQKTSRHATPVTMNTVVTVCA